MIASIYFGIAASIICAILFISLFIRKLYKGRNNKHFLVLILIIFSVALLDTITNSFGVFIETSRSNVLIQWILNSAYFLTHNYIPLCYILYISKVMGFHHKLMESKPMFALIYLPFAVDVVLLAVNIFVPVVFGFDDNGAYYRCKYMSVLFVVAGIYAIEALVCVIKHRNDLKTLKVILLGLSLPATSATVALQMINPNLRIETLVLAIFLIFNALYIHRPEEYVDHIMDSQSNNAFIKDIDIALRNNRQFSLLLVKNTNHAYLKQNFGLDNFTRLLQITSEKVSTAVKSSKVAADIYYLGKSTFAVCVDRQKEDMLIAIGENLAENLKEHIIFEEIEVVMNFRLLHLNVPEDISSKYELINLIVDFPRYISNESKLQRLSDYCNSRDFMIRTNLDNIIARAIMEGNLKMYYQPIYSVEERKFVSAEALIRLIDDEYGFVPPGVFIPEAEESGAIHEIGTFVIDDVCRFINERNVASYGVEYIEINLSVAQCIEPDLVDKFNEALEVNDITPDRLNLEITETAMDYDPATTSKNIDALRKAGFSFSLDDYGTGYSNIARVNSLPVDIVKIDKSMADSITDGNMFIIVEKTIDMLKKLNKKILVEGIEDKETLDIFIGLGCDYIQGYYFSKPLPEDEFIEFVRKENA